MKTTVKLKTIKAAMRASMTRGVDPRNSHEVQQAMLVRHWKMESGRRRTEAQANRELHQTSALLQRQCGDALHHEEMWHKVHDWA